MKNKEAEELLLKYKAGTATAEEKALVETWYARFKDRVSAVPGDQVSADQAESWAIFEREYANSAKVTKLWPRIAVAAAAVAAIVFGVYFFNTSRQSRLDTGNPGSAQYATDIAPGKNGATITLSNDKVIQLSDAKSGVVVGQDLKYNDGAAVQGGGPDLRQDEVMQLTARTARGQTYQFTLPDGTKVWLNADSKISFPSRFPGEERKILLSGEAYFEVAKLSRSPLRGGTTRQSNDEIASSRNVFRNDERIPFLVESNNQTVEVLGTHFNISAYQEERLTTTTLVEGSVRVSAFDVAAGRRTEILKPNQQSIQNQSGGMQVRNVDVSEALDWKNGEFIFKREPLQNIMRRVSRWYDVQIIYESRIDVNETFSGVVSRKKNISEVLNLMGLNGQLKFRIEGKKVYVGK